MSGKHSRRKGARGERELAAILGARKISRSGYIGPDLEWRGYPVEVKRRRTNSGYALIDRLLGDTPIVAVRADRGEWLISMRPETLLDLLDTKETKR